jgi:DNA polymerase-3 subunit epsilon
MSFELFKKNSPAPEAKINCDFIALDVETANHDYWSICQVGLAYFRDGEVIHTWHSLVNPQTEFEKSNIRIHGITPEHVKKAMHLPEIYQLINHKLADSLVVHHTHFDRTALTQLAHQVHQDCVECFWLDSSRVARYTWEEVKSKGYGLDNLSFILNIPREKPHDALDDAITAGRVLHRAVSDSGISLTAWMRRAEENYVRWKRTTQEFHTLAAAEPDSDGPLFGEVVVFTGELSVSRMQAAQMAFSLGCNIDEKVTRKTTLLVVGDQDLRLLAGHEKSTKHRYAEELITKGVPIRIVSESGFWAMLSS